MPTPPRTVRAIPRIQVPTLARRGDLFGAEKLEDDDGLDGDLEDLAVFLDALERDFFLGWGLFFGLPRRLLFGDPLLRPRSIASYRSTDERTGLFLVLVAREMIPSHAHISYFFFFFHTPTCRFLRAGV